jgi:CheY-like chemotaxis protein
VKVLYLEDDLRDIELLRMTCAHEQPDCQLSPVMDRATFVAALQTGRYDGILSDSGVHDLLGADAVQIARSMAPGLPYVFLCGMLNDAKRADLEAAKPDGIFSKDRAEDVDLAIGLIRTLSEKARA